MSRRLVAVLLAAAVLASVAGCAPESGTVTRTYIQITNKQPERWLCATDSRGDEGCQVVSVDTYQSCATGDRWPDCKSRRP